MSSVFWLIGPLWIDRQICARPAYCQPRNRAPGYRRDDFTSIDPPSLAFSDKHPVTTRMSDRRPTASPWFEINGTGRRRWMGATERRRQAMGEETNIDDTGLGRRDVLLTAGAAMLTGISAVGPVTSSAANAQGAPRGTPSVRDTAPLGARLQGVQHFGVTVQNMDRAFEFYTEVLGGTEVMRDGDFQGETIHNTLLTDQEIVARERKVNPRTIGVPDLEGRRAAPRRPLRPVRQCRDRAAAISRRRAADGQRRQLCRAARSHEPGLSALDAHLLLHSRRCRLQQVHP